MVWLVVAVSVASLLVTSALAVVILVRLPADHFRRKRSWPKRILANLVGLVLVIVGIVLSFPGVPGQGILTVAVGLLLLEFPGRRRLLLWLFSKPRIRRGADRIRARFGKKPLTVD